VSDKWKPTIEPTPCLDKNGVCVTKGMTVRCDRTEHTPPFNQVEQEGVTISDPVFVRNVFGDHYWTVSIKGNGWSTMFTRVHTLEAVVEERAAMTPFESAEAIERGEHRRGEAVTEEQIALARRAVACKGWRWMPGMLRLDGYRACHRIVPRALIPAEDVPDLTDPATLGCLLALVREAWKGDEWISCAYARKERSWVVTSCHISALLVSGMHIHGATEAEALVAALEAAP
jgi:hypothetical protein